MSKCAYECRSSKRKKATAKADALQAAMKIRNQVCQKDLEILQHEYFKTELALSRVLNGLPIL